MPDHASTVAERVRAARRRAGLSREELAVRCGLSWGAIAQIESGRRANPRVQTVAALAAGLGVTSNYLLAMPERPLLQHHALIYGGTDDFAQSAGAFLLEGIELGETALVVSSRDNSHALRKYLGVDARRVRFAPSDDWYTSPREAVQRYRDYASEALAAGAPWLRVVGEPVWEGRSSTQIAAWARYELLLNVVFAGIPLSLACPYDQDTLRPAILRHACATHKHTLTHGEMVANATYDPDGCM
jgi:transcriptional regulator with XRE-family HTH domain